jgi:Fic family protein
MTTEQTFTPDKDGYLRVETNRSGHFVFQIGLDKQALEIPRLRAEEAYARFSSMPMIADVSNQLEKMSLVTSIHSTNTIEGGELDRRETEELIMSPKEFKNEAEQRVSNLKEAYDLAAYLADFFFKEGLDKEQQKSAEIQGSINIAISEKIITDLHAEITKNLQHEDNIPGKYRNNPKHRKTKVGDKDHGGEYTPPKCLEDVNILMEAFISWANCEAVMGLPPLLRAPLLHFYFELIHPFWDGNGRTGRVLEALTLQCARYKYAPYAISKFYLNHIDEYFSLFNKCRKLALKKEDFPNTEFVKFHLDGFLSTINRLHDRANIILSKILYSSHVNILFSQKKINSRQYTILNNLPTKTEYEDLETLKNEPWYTALYLNLTNRTAKRDLDRLVALDMIRFLDGRKKIKIKYAKPEIILSESPITSTDRDTTEDQNS